MTRAEQNTNLIGVVLPFLGVIAAIVLLWERAVDGIDIAILATMYLFTGIGVTVGFHRLLTHRSWHAHTGWLVENQGQADWTRYARDLYDDPSMRQIGRRFPLLVFASLAIPTIAGFVLHGFTLGGALRGYIWGALVRIFIVHHVTWSVNSICHFFGRRRFEIEDQSTNVAWLSVVSLGESWHHNHHAFSRSAFHGLRRWEIDPSGLLISALERVGLAWNVVRIAPERQLQKTLPQTNTP